MKALFQTRFAYHGILPWASERANAPELVFDPRYLDARLRMMEQFMLPSIADQTDDDFHLYCLTSSDLPVAHLGKLTDLLDAFIGAERYDIVQEQPAQSWMRSILWTREKFGAETELAQICLDDDDAVAVDFVELCKLQSQFLLESDFFNLSFRLLSFANGYAAQTESGVITKIAPRHLPFTAPGLICVGPGQCVQSATVPIDPDNIIPESNVVTASRPFYLKLHHDTNDKSHSAITGDMTADDIEKIETYFPFLIGAL